LGLQCGLLQLLLVSGLGLLPLLLHVAHLSLQAFDTVLSLLLSSVLILLVCRNPLRLHVQLFLKSCDREISFIQLGLHLFLQLRKLLLVRIFSRLHLILGTLLRLNRLLVDSFFHLT
jgi:hypothetical protein